MNNMEVYWEIANHTIAILNILVECLLFYKFIKPFMKEKAFYVGVSYSVTMLIFYCVPQEIIYPYLWRAIVACVTMCLLEKRNIKQKVFLSSVMYLFRWMVYGVTLLLRDVMFELFIDIPYMHMNPVKQWIVYIIVELIYYSVAITAMYFVIKLFHKVYVNKKEDISEKELLLLFATLLTVMLGYFTFNFFSRVYLEDMEIYIWNAHPGYTFLRMLYQIVSFATVLIAVVTYQKIKEKQREENVNLLLEEQIENTKQHINEVEKLYENIRALKHDMGNHITVLESLFAKKETEEFEKYLTELKATYCVSVEGIKTGNPVTDVILTQKQKEAEESGIGFECNFVYPVDSNINAFDISVILNNAIENAFEGVRGCKDPYVLISAYRKKNAYMMEVRNCISRYIEIDTETGLPETTKEDKRSHGFGLTNIRRVAQKYYGDIDISQDEKSFTLTVMLMIE